jgi:multimeric flavodoxin WrbA
MKILAINGSPRKNRNTAALLKSALDGAAQKGADTELIHLYDLHFKGCVSCFACKLKAGKSYGRCAFKDDLTPILKKIEDIDALLLGSPIYFGCVTGEMRSFLERLLFPYAIYDQNYSTLFKKKIPTAFIYTMNVNEQRLKESGYDYNFILNQRVLAHVLGASEWLCSTDTYQFDDYTKYEVTAFDPEAKAMRHKEIFPEDLKQAFALGARMVEGQQ